MFLISDPRVRMSKSFLLGSAVLFLSCAGVFSIPAAAQSAFDDPGARTPSGVAGDFRAMSENLTGDVSLGASSQIVVLFRNDDTKPIQTGAISLYPSSNISANVGENQCDKSPVAPGEICAVSLQIKGLQQGSYRIEMLIRHEGRSKLLTTTVNGQVVSSGDASTDLVSDIEAIPSSIDFGSLNESRSQVRSIVLRNITSEPITISDVDIQAGAQSGFNIRQNCGELQTGEACVASVEWSPEQRGPSSGVVVVRHTGATGVATVELKGIYTPESATSATIFPQAVPGKGLLISSEEDIDFGTSVAQATSATVSLVNTGDVPLDITSIRLSSPDNGIRIESRGCKNGQKLAPIAACPLTLTWSPVRVGAISDNLEITHTGARGVLVLPVKGTSTRAVNKNTRPVTPTGSAFETELFRNIAPLSMQDLTGIDEIIDSEGTPQMRANGARSALEGYVITSYATNRAIISGPGGTRVVMSGERTVIGGILWEVFMRPYAVEFRNGDQKVLLLFDASLSSVNQNGGQSSGATSGGTTFQQ